MRNALPPRSSTARRGQISPAAESAGAASVEAYKKALAVRADAEKITEEIGTLEPRAQAAAADAAVAGIALKETQDEVKTQSDALDDVTARTSGSAKLATDLHGVATKMIEQDDKDGQGLAAQLKAFAAEREKLAASLANVTKFTSQAKSALGSASRSLSTGTPALDQQLTSLMHTLDSVASYRAAGQANLTAYVAATLQNPESMAMPLPPTPPPSMTKPPRPPPSTPKPTSAKTPTPPSTPLIRLSIVISAAALRAGHRGS